MQTGQIHETAKLYRETFCTDIYGIITVNMRILFIFAILVLAVSSAYADSAPLPPEVEAFVRDRDLCDHFRGEPYEGNSPEQIRRREFVSESLEIFCPGTDRRLAALKRRWKDNPEVMKVLEKYEERIEGKADFQSGFADRQVQHQSAICQLHTDVTHPHHAGKSRYPELSEITGFRLAPE